MRRGWFWALCLATLLGCEGGESKFTLQGVVRLEGTPLDRGVVNFLGRGRPSGGPIAANGSYEVKLPAGTYDVVIVQGIDLPSDWKEGGCHPRHRPAGGAFQICQCQDVWPARDG